MFITNEMVLKYKPLVIKISNQFSKKTHVPYSDIESVAWEGLVLAFKNYDTRRSTMSFLSYAAYSIRNNILTAISNEFQLIKLSPYAQKWCQTHDCNITKTPISIDTNESIDDDENNTNFDTERYLYTQNTSKYDESITDITSNIEISNLFEILQNKFSERDFNIFIKSYGLFGENLEKKSIIAQIYNISPASVTQINKKIINFIRNNSDLKEIIYSNINYL